jgi:hypothetical protein
MWNIYYHFYLDEPDILVLESQADKLRTLSQTLQAWHTGPYGATLRFCDEATLLLVHAVWAKYAGEARTLRLDEDSRRAFFEDNLRTARWKQHHHAKRTSRQDVSRSCAPLVTQLSDKLLFSAEQHWKTGLAGSVPLPNAAKNKTPIPNPVFAVPLMTSTVLKHPTDPLLGFHLAGAHANLEDKPLPRPEETDGGHQDSSDALFVTARAQFDQGIVAFSTHADCYTIRFTASECFSLCHTLRHNLETGETCAQHYRAKVGFDVLKLAESDYGASGKAPKQFDVIDTSTLSHDVSILNLLVSAGPLLKDAPSSTLYTADLYRMGGTDGFEKLLLEHTTIIVILLGLVPAEYWTNAKAVSIVDQILAALSDKDATPEAKNTVSGFRLSWKHNKHMAGQQPNASLHTNIEAVVAFAVHIFRFMIRIPRDSRPASEDQLKALIPKRLPVLQHHPGTMAAFLRRVGEQTQMGSAELCEKFVREISEPFIRASVGDPLGGFALEVPSLGPELAASCGWRSSKKNARPAFRDWDCIPQTVAVTVVVSPLEWDVLSPSWSRHQPNPPATAALIPPAAALITGRLRLPGKKDMRGADMRTEYADTQISFGTVTTEGSRDKADFTVHVKEDKAGWMGTSPMVISFRVPTVFVEAVYGEAVVGFRALLADPNSDGCEQPWRDDEFCCYEKPFSDQDHVFITRYQPGRTTCTPQGLRTTKAPSTEPSETTFTADFDMSNPAIQVIRGITGRFNIISDQGKKLLADKAPIEVHQTSPFTLAITIGKDIPQALTLPLTFPAPILQTGSKIRIARKSSYIEISAPLAHPSTNPPILDPYLLPTTLPREPPFRPVTLNTPHLSLPTLPILSLADRARPRFLTTLTSLMFSTRERRAREEAAAASSPRLGFKESLFPLFMLSAGLQGGQTGLFALSQPGRGGVHVLILVGALRLDAAHGSVVLDAAVLPLTRALVDSRAVEGFLLVLRELECCTLTVDDGELGVWKTVLPGMVERCREWEHGPGCEYVEAGRVPVGLGEGERVLCGCGEGKLPREFERLPEWETAARFATRVAISPVYASALVEELIAPELTQAVTDDLSGKGEGKTVGRNCGKVEGIEGVTLRRCTRCLGAVYCSAECQRTDWKKHRMECHESAEHEKK